MEPSRWTVLSLEVTFQRQLLVVADEGACASASDIAWPRRITRTIRINLFQKLRQEYLRSDHDCPLGGEGPTNLLPSMWLLREEVERPMTDSLI
jgi:hypothetical protein